jgi:hypothetical protein
LDSDSNMDADFEKSDPNPVKIRPDPQLEFNEEIRINVGNRIKF